MRRGSVAAVLVLVVGIVALGVAVWTTELIEPLGRGQVDSGANRDTTDEAAATDEDSRVADDTLAVEEPEADGVHTSRGTFFVWGRDVVDIELAQAIAPLADVDAVALVTSATVGLTGSRDAAGEPVDELPAGFRIPMALTAIDPDSYLATLSAATAPGDRDAVGSLQPGEAIISESAARMRGIGPGGQLDLVGAEELLVTAIVADGVGQGEVLVHLGERDRLGLGESGALIVRHVAAPGADTTALGEAIGAIADDDGVRVFDAGGHGGDADAPLILSLPDVKHRFGEFAYRPRRNQREIDIDPDWVDANIVDIELPVLGTVRCHHRIADDLRAAMDEIVASGFDDWIDPGSYGGCYYPRHIDTTRDNLSRHAWGIAIDINVDLSRDDLGPVPPDPIIQAFARHGFRWGGDFIQPDNHHWEWIGPAATSRPGARPDS